MCSQSNERPERFSGHLIARGGFAAALLIAVLVRLPHLTAVPFWDSRTYWDECLQPALSRPFDPLAFNCSNHRSVLYMLTIAGPQYLVRNSAVVLNLTNLGLSLIAVLAFYGIALTLFPLARAKENGSHVALLTVLFASMPTWTASSVTINPDFGVLVGFLVALYCFLRGRLWSATLAGFFMTLSKEIGLLLWIALVGIDFLFAAVESRRAGGRAIASLVAKRLVMAAPVVAYLLVGRALAARNAAPVPNIWHPSTGIATDTTVSLIKTFLTFDPTDETYRAYAADIFILNFDWILTVVIVAWLIMVLAGLLRDRGVKELPATDVRSARFIGLIAFIAFYLVTRYPTFNNPRYLLAALPMFVLVFGMAAMAAIPRQSLRSAVIAVTAVLGICSMNATIDPLSRLVFGTFPFGQHRMLHMTRFTDECCGMGRDQLVYNLQFMHFGYIQNKLYETIRPGDQDVLSMSSLGPWYFVGQLDARTFHRTLATTDVVRPRLYTLRDREKGTPLPDSMLYVAYPNLPSAYDLRLYAQWYDIGDPRMLDEHGYQVITLRLKRRAAV